MKLFRRKAKPSDHNADFYGSYGDTVTTTHQGSRVFVQRFEGAGSTHATVILQEDEARRMMRDLQELLEGADQ